MSTLRNIAEELDLSISLVSKVLNGRLGTTGASPQTVELIQDTARRLNYRKNFSAESLATGRQRAIGIFMHRHGFRSSAITEATIIGAAERAGLSGQRLVLRFFTTESEFHSACAEVNLNALDGVILAGVMHSDLVAQLGRMRGEGVPVITVHHDQVTKRVPNVGCDNVRVGELATEHLIAQGCKRIAHIHSDHARHKGYELALKKAGLPILPELIFATGGAEPGFGFGAEAARHWLDKGIEMDGFAAEADEQLAAAMKVFLAAGRRIPQDIKVVGVDNSPFCELFPIPLSSVSQEDQRRGQIAVELLLDMVDGKDVRSQVIDPVLFARESSGA